MNLSLLTKIPEFSDKNFTVASYICGALLSASSGFFVYEMFTAVDFGINVNWNIFDSLWFGPLYVVGLILAIVNWGKFGHWGGQPYDVYKDGYGNKYTKRNDDIIENLFAHIIMPLLGHFLIEPIIYACLIYYPLMCVFALLGLILPYALTVLLVGLSGAVFASNRIIAQMRYRSLILVCMTLLVGGGLIWFSINMQQAKNLVIEIQEQPKQQEKEEDMFNEKNKQQENTDDMFGDL